MDIQFPAWVTSTKCETYTNNVIHGTKHGIVRQETVWLTDARLEYKKRWRNHSPYAF